MLAMLLLVQSPLEDQSEADEFEPQGGFSAMQGDLAQPRLKMLVCAHLPFAIQQIATDVFPISGAARFY